MSQLPPFGKFAYVWVEITKSELDHGGAGWEFGKCLWSPERNRGGADFYAIMREVAQGDLVLHFYEQAGPDQVVESRFVGFSVASGGFEVRTDEPPHASEWTGRGKYYYIPLRRYTPLDKPLPIRVLREDYALEIEDEVRASAPSYYPFSVRSDGIRLTQGVYLAQCTQRLYYLIQEALGIESAIDFRSSSDAYRHQQFSEGKRYAREVKFFLQNAKFAKQAKKRKEYKCEACGFNPTHLYGDAGEQCIECHDTASHSERYPLTAKNLPKTSKDDIMVLCANCHRLVHSRTPALSKEELLFIVRGKTKA